MSSFTEPPKKLQTILDHRGYGINKSDLTPRELAKHKKELAFKPVVMPGYDFAPPRAVNMWRESPNRLWVPKFYGIGKFGPPARIREQVGKPIDVEFTGSLKPAQVEILGKVLPKLKEHGGGSLCLPTGFGKTVCAIWIACTLGVKTLWVTHKTNLMEQTRERFEMFTGESVGTIQQNKVDIKHPFVIGMLQSIAMKDYPPETFSDFGLVIFDEAHHVPSHVFSQCLWKLGARYNLGLSATIERKDQLEIILNMCLGPILATVQAQIKTPIIKRITAAYDLDNEKIEHVNTQGMPDTAKLLNDMVEDITRNNLIIKAAIDAYIQGRNVLILSDRVQHCKSLRVRIAAKLPSRINKEGRVAPGDVGLYIGGLKHTELAIANFCDIIVATYNMCAEGYDNPDLNTVILSTSKRDVRQAAGRVLGLRSGGGFRPLIIDIADTWGAARNQAAARLKWYRENNFEIEGQAPRKTALPPIEKYKPAAFSLDDEE
ncbi:MAG: hypothetical protein CMM25_01360 [Rhodospirillaceae bacterium]|nr:hypothetical protein [Rhodospirillaceae bacterium]